MNREDVSSEDASPPASGSRLADIYCFDGELCDELPCPLCECAKKVRGVEGEILIQCQIGGHSIRKYGPEAEVADLSVIDAKELSQFSSQVGSFQVDQFVRNSQRGETISERDIISQDFMPDIMNMESNKREPNILCSCF